VFESTIFDLTFRKLSALLALPNELQLEVSHAPNMHLFDLVWQTVLLLADLAFLAEVISVGCFFGLVINCIQLIIALFVHLQQVQT